MPVLNPLPGGTTFQVGSSADPGAALPRQMSRVRDHIQFGTDADSRHWRYSRIANQRERILAEMDHLLATPHAERCAQAALRRIRSEADRCAQRSDGLVELIWWSLHLRHELLSRAPRSTWRESLSWIGRLPDEPPGVVSYEYMRSEQHLRSDAVWAGYYPWLSQDSVRSVCLLHTSGMASIASWFFALRHVAQQRSRITVVCTPLYFETRQLLERLLPGSRIEAVYCKSHDDFIRTIRRHSAGEVIAYLDSGETADTVRLFRWLCQEGVATRLRAIAWDNTLVPYWFDPLGDNASFPTPLFLLRSVHKLDQLGLELASAGLLTAATPRQVTTSSADVLKAILDELTTATKIVGATAAPTSLRLLHSLQLPNKELARAQNTATRRATTWLAEELATRLREPLKVVEFPHNFFVNVRCSAHDRSAVERVMDDIVARARAERLPIERAASLGFNFTGMSTFMGVDPESGDSVTYLRLAVGGHDQPVLDRVARCICEVLDPTNSSNHAQWSPSRG